MSKSILSACVVCAAIVFPQAASAQAVMRLSSPSDPLGVITAATPNWDKPNRNNPTWIDPSIDVNGLLNNTTPVWYGNDGGYGPRNNNNNLPRNNPIGNRGGLFNGARGRISGR